MVRAGWGVVYTGAGAEYGGWGQDAFLAAQAEAQYVFFLCLSFCLLLPAYSLSGVPGLTDVDLN